MGSGLSQGQRAVDVQRALGTKAKLLAWEKCHGEPAVVSWENEGVWPIALPTLHADDAANRDTGNGSALWHKDHSPPGTSKKLGDQETFTGMMDEGYEILAELEDMHRSSSDVVAALPDHATPYTVGQLEAGENLNGPKCGESFVGSSFYCEGVFVADGGVSKQCLSKTLIARLRTCCRNTDSKTAVATDVPSKPEETAVAFLPD